LSNRSLGKIVNKYFDEYPDRREVFIKAMPNEKRKTLEDLYSTMGLKYIGLESFGDGDSQALLLKEQPLSSGS